MSCGSLLCSRWEEGQGLTPRVRTYESAHTWLHVCTRTHTCVHVSAYVCTSVRVCLHVCTCSRVCVCISVCWRQVCLQAEQRCHLLRTLSSRLDRTKGSQGLAGRRLRSDARGQRAGRAWPPPPSRAPGQGRGPRGAVGLVPVSPPPASRACRTSSLVSVERGEGTRSGPRSGRHAPGQSPAAQHRGLSPRLPRQDGWAQGPCHLRGRHRRPTLPLWARRAHVPSHPASSR